MKIALVGISGSGKTTISKYLCQRYGYSLCSTGMVCRNISNILFGTEDRKYLNYVTDMIKKVDEQLLLSAALRKMDFNCVFDSVRYLTDYSMLKQNGFLIVKVECEKTDADNRLTFRGQKYDQADLLHSSETEIQKIPYDYILKNEGEVEKLYQDVDKLITCFEGREETQ